METFAFLGFGKIGANDQGRPEFIDHLIQCLNPW